jgi:Raf kinase inhibitor-like YbhB/YbcL family protein
LEDRIKITLLKSAIAGVVTVGLATAALAAAAGGGGGGAAAPAAPPAGTPGTVAPAAKTVYDNLVTATTPKLTLTSTSIKAGETIRDDFSQNGANKSPQLTWAAGPAATRSYVVIAQDITTNNPTPIQHWILWNIPANVTSLPEGLPVGVNVANPAGAMQATAGNTAGYRGPRPPAGTVHQYVFQVYALDTALMGLETTANAPAIQMAMMGHVLAAGSFAAPYTGK